MSPWRVRSGAARRAGLARDRRPRPRLPRGGRRARCDRTADVYWAGRAALCTWPGRYRRGTTRCSRPGSPESGRGGVARRTPRAVARRPHSMPTTAPRARTATGRVERRPRAATEVLRHRDVAELSASDRAELARLFGTLRPRVPRPACDAGDARRTGARSTRGRTLRAQLRQVGEPARVALPAAAAPGRAGSSYWSTSPARCARTPTACCGSRTRWSSRRPRSVEVFTIGTRLTRVTRGAASPRRRVRAACGGGRRTGLVGWYPARRGAEGVPGPLGAAGDGAACRRRGVQRRLGARGRRAARRAMRAAGRPRAPRGLGQSASGQARVPAGAGRDRRRPAACRRLVAGHSLASFAELLEVVADA